jgi:acyl-CoA synthetase (AMP-forming)/AMP-acid ligase II
VPRFAEELALLRPDQIAIRDPDTELRWADLDTILNQVANRLGPHVALGAHRRVAVFAENAVTCPA